MSEKQKTEHMAKVPSLETSATEALNSQAFQQGQWPSDLWWEMFESPILNSWIAEALENNPSLQATQARVVVAKEHSLAVKSKLFPFLFFDANDNISYFSKNGIDHLYNTSLPLHGYELNLSLSFQYEFDFWNKNRNRFRAALGEMRAKEAEWAQARLILSTALAQSYFALAITERRYQLYQELTKVKQQKLALQEDLYKSSLSSLLDPLLLSQQVDEVKIIADSLADELQTQAHLINIFRGKGPDSPLETAILPTTLPPSFLPENLSIDLLARRPDLAAQIWRVESIAYEVSVAKADFYPSVNLSAFAGLQSLSFSKLFSLSSKTGNIEPAIHLPIFTGGELTANLKGKKALFDEAVFEYNSLLLTAAQEVTDLISHIQMSYKQKKQQESSVSDAQKRYQLTELNWKGNLVSRFSLLDQQEELILQMLKDLDILYTEYAFHIQLIKALGGGYLTSLPIGPRS